MIAKLATAGLLETESEEHTNNIKRQKIFSSVTKYYIKYKCYLCQRRGNYYDLTAIFFTAILQKSMLLKSIN